MKRHLHLISWVNMFPSWQISTLYLLVFCPQRNNSVINWALENITGLPWWLSGKEFTCQCKKYELEPWVRKIPWKRKWQPTPVFLPGKSHGQRSLAGYSPSGHKGEGHDLPIKNNNKRRRAYFQEYN